jgi:hypothetical protein
MTPLQNDSQLHQRKANNRHFRTSRGGKRSPDSESECRELSKSGLASHFGPRTCDFTSNSGGGTTAGAPTRTRVRPSRNQCTTEPSSSTPYRFRCWGELSFVLLPRESAYHVGSARCMPCRCLSVCSACRFVGLLLVSRDPLLGRDAHFVSCA